MKIAVPYSQRVNLDDLSPGLRYGLYLDCWDTDWKTAKKFEIDKIQINHSSEKNLRSLRRRQEMLFEEIEFKKTIRVIGNSRAPFSTGLGNEHPLENGFAFLNPYGLPYLPGSSVKGVLRRAAEELIHDDYFGTRDKWSLADIWYLFGLENIPSGLSNKYAMDDSDVKKFVDSIAPKNTADRIMKSKHPIKALMNENLQFRGTLQFWDVFVDCRELIFDIMVPHHRDYFMHSSNEYPPHDSESPVPIHFLTVPSQSTFVFHVCCDTIRLEKVAPHLTKDNRWKSTIETVFEHAFQWLGFGAKTAVGYGAMKRDENAENKLNAMLVEQAKMKKHEEQERKRIERETAGMSPIEKQIHNLIANRPNKNEPESTFLFNFIRDGEWVESEKIEAAELLMKRMKKDGIWKESSAKKNPNKDKDHQRTLKIQEWLKGLG